MLASNGTHDWDLDYRGQFVVANNTAWLRSLEERVVREAAAGGAEGAAMATSALARSKLRGRTDRLRERMGIQVARYRHHAGGERHPHCAGEQRPVV